jgi:hypothetical protein
VVPDVSKDSSAFIFRVKQRCLTLKVQTLIIIIIIIINIKGWAIWPVPSPEVQLLSPTFL